MKYSNHPTKYIRK